MTVSSEVSTAGPYNGNGVTVIFPYGFKIVDETHLRVVVIDALGTATDLSFGDGDYTVSGVGNDAGGNVTVVVAPATGEKLTILRNPPLTQETDLENQGPYSASVVEARFDMLTMQVQKVNEATDRSFQVSPGLTPPSLDEIEAAVDNAAAAAASASAAATSKAQAETAKSAAEAAATAAASIVYTGYGTAIHGATAKTSLADADEFGIWDSVAAGLAKATLANLIASIFKTARTIANAQFASASFKLFNAAGTPRALSFVTTALTADRTLTMPDANVDLSNTLKSGNVVTLSGAAVDLTGIPAGTKRITISVENMSTNGTTGVSLQIGDSGGIEATGYLCATSNGNSSTTEFILTGGSGAAAAIYHGSVVLSLIDAATNKWAASSVIGRSDVAACLSMGGAKATSATLDRVRLKGGNGTDTFDGGTVNILYE